MLWAEPLNVCVGGPAELPRTTNDAMKQYD